MCLLISLIGGPGTLSPSTQIDMLFYACMRLAGGLFWIALLVGLAGYLVRAISFLPGRSDIEDQDF
jgi:hypothetical protein